MAGTFSLSVPTIDPPHNFMGNANMREKQKNAFFAPPPPPGCWDQTLKGPKRFWGGGVGVNPSAPDGTAA